MQFRLIVHHDFNLLAGLVVESVAHGSILCGDILSKRNILSARFLHALGTLYECLDIVTGARDRQQSYRSEY